MTPVASVVAAAVAGEDVGLIAPLMESLEHDLLPRDDGAPEAFGVRLHRFDAAVERALRDWESEEELRGAMSGARATQGRGVDRHRRAARGGLATVLDPTAWASG